MISIQQMQYIVTVAEERQFQRASERCFVTQPTLSMQIKKAEQTLGNQIFDRSRSPLELTEYGKELLVIVRDVLSEYSRVKLLGEQRSGAYREQVKVGIIPTIAGYMLPGMFDEWMKDLKDVELIIEGGLNRPPYEKDKGITKLFEHAKNLASEIGFTLEDVKTGGGSDGNFTAAAGVPTLDGLGADGNGAHTHEEFIYYSSLVERTQLMLRLFETLE